jgi:hypothetical protein
MSVRPPARVPTPLSIACRQFEQWRSRRQGRTRLPGNLWAKAVRLAREHGISKTARTLGLEYAVLKKRLAAFGPVPEDPGKRGVPSGPPDFIELLPGRLKPGSPECTIEWEDGSGAKVRMHVEGIGVPDLVVLAGRLWSGQA